MQVASTIARSGSGNGVLMPTRRRRCRVSVVAVMCVFAAGCTQIIGAGTSSTNLPTETVWPGAQNAPYVCCWDAQGQFVTFSFTVVAGATDLTLRYSAGNGVATRKLELDGTVWTASQAFPATTNWSTWTTLTLTRTLTGGAHTLKIWFDGTAGSSQFLNLDNLTVSQSAPPPAGVTVSLGYADSSTGITPWLGSPNTTFIGETPQCCSTHGPNNGGNGYDGGAIEVANNSAAPVTVNSVTADFGGGSSPAHFDLWGATTTPHLPQVLAPGARLVLTATSTFNFDTSDLFGEACHINAGVVPAVHVTVNGALTDYDDSHQILNSDGADLASCPGDVSEQHVFTAVVPGVQPVAAPVNDILPSITTAGTAAAPGTPVTDRVVSGFAGAWNASPPPALALQWTRCDAGGNGCVAIAGATTPTFVPTAADVGRTLRLHVTASSASSSVTASSAPTTIVQTGPAMRQLGHTLTGFSSLFVNNPTELSWLEMPTGSGTSTDFAFFARGAGNDQVFIPRIYAAPNGQKGSLLASGAPVTVPKGANGRWYVSDLSGLRLTTGTQVVFAVDPSGSFNGTYLGSEANGEPAFFVDYAPG